MLDIWPTKAQFRKGDPIEVILHLPESADPSDSIEITVCRLFAQIYEAKLTVEQIKKNNEIYSLDDFVGIEGEGYHIYCKLFHGNQVIQAKSAFDIALHWRSSPRYGFLFNFCEQTEQLEAGVQDFFRKFHLNLVQFYDWMYRHDNLVPHTENFTDPMGRRLNRTSIQNKIRFMKDIQTACIAYGAVYASLKDFASEHPDWGLYDNQGKQYDLIDRFYLMDISEKSPWRDHMINQYKQAISFGFDGIHLDQYGFPKTALRSNGDAIWMDDCYSSFVNACKNSLGNQVGLIFNAVNAYPLNTVINSTQDVVYVEVWPPMNRFRHLREIISRVRHVDPSKKVILAAYLHPFNESDDPGSLERTALLTTAMIFSSGGFHLLLGENGRVLAEAYYPNCGMLSDEIQCMLRNMYDVVTADAALLSGESVVDLSLSVAGGINDDVKIDGAKVSIDPEPGTVYLRVTKTALGLVIHFINFMWIQNDEWNRLHDEPFCVSPPLTITIEWNFPVHSVYLQQAEEGGWKRCEFDWVEHIRGKAIHCSIPSVNIWSMLFIPYEPDSRLVEE